MSIHLFFTPWNWQLTFIKCRSLFSQLFKNIYFCCLIKTIILFTLPLSRFLLLYKPSWIELKISPWPCWNNSAYLDQLRKSFLQNSGYYTVFITLPFPGSLKNRTPHANREIRLMWWRFHHIYTLPWLSSEGVLIRLQWKFTCRWFFGSLGHPKAGSYTVIMYQNTPWKCWS